MQTLEKTNESVFTVRDDEVQEGWERWYLLFGDAHLDNPHCRRDLFQRHLEEAFEKKAKAFSFGDLFCAMGGKYDPRRSKTDIRPENNNDHYLDSLVRNNAKFLAPWSDLFGFFSDGNHETAISGHCETDLTQRLADDLGTERMGYAGYIRFMFSAASGGRRTQRLLFFHHGSGGGGEVTKGLPQSIRTAVWTPDADIVVGAHIHEHFLVAVPRSRVSSSGATYLDEQLHIQLPTYKDEFHLKGGYHIQNKRPPKPLGAVFLRFYFDGRRMGSVGVQAIRAD